MNNYTLTCYIYLFHVLRRHAYENILQSASVASRLLLDCGMRSVRGGKTFLLDAAIRIVQHLGNASSEEVVKRRRWSGLAALDGDGYRASAFRRPTSFRLISDGRHCEAGVFSLFLRHDTQHARAKGK